MTAAWMHVPDCCTPYPEGPQCQDDTGDCRCDTCLTWLLTDLSECAADPALEPQRHPTLAEWREYVETLCGAQP